MISKGLWVALFLLELYTQPARGEIAGQARVVDGDTLEIGAVKVRLYGIDAPEAKQTCQRDGLDWLCGAAAAKHLRDLIGGADVSCEGDETDRYGRTIAVCQTSTLELNAAMVQAGMALAFRRYSSKYVEDEDGARVKKLGLWSGTFIAPWDWRHSHQVYAAAPQGNEVGETSGPPECLIKGNIGSGGKHIYHVPGDRDYAKTKISLNRGERWFCTEADAIAAGWRKAGTH